MVSLASLEMLTLNPTITRSSGLFNVDTLIISFFVMSPIWASLTLILFCSISYAMASSEPMASAFIVIPFSESFISGLDSFISSLDASSILPPFTTIIDVPEITSRLSVIRIRIPAADFMLSLSSTPFFPGARIAFTFVTAGPAFVFNAILSPL